jgi:hypothetical protein
MVKVTRKMRHQSSFQMGRTCHLECNGKLIPYLAMYSSCIWSRSLFIRVRFAVVYVNRIDDTTLYKKLFAESKHAYGRKCLRIPNIRHFGGITKSIPTRSTVVEEPTRFTGTRSVHWGYTEEQYEDSHGNVFSRATYKDLARQGLLCNHFS